MEIIKQIAKYKRLLDAGVLTKEEYDRKKAQLFKQYFPDFENGTENHTDEESNDETEEIAPNYETSVEPSSAEVEFQMAQEKEVHVDNVKVINNQPTGNQKNEEKTPKSKTTIIILSSVVVVILAILLIMNKCNQHEKIDHTGENPYENAIMEEESADVSTAATLPVEEATFITPDLAFAGVRGHVKSITTEDGVYKFTKDGRVTTWPSRIPAEYERDINRDDDGFITSICYSTICCDQYEFDKKNTRLTKIDFGYDDCSKNITFIYNEQGVVIKEDEKIVSYPDNEPGDEIEDDYVPQEPETTYKSHIISIIETDVHGNWVKRRYDNTIQTRSIEYYTDENNSSVQKIAEEHDSKSSQKEMDRNVDSSIVGKWEYTDTDYDSEDDFTYLEMQVSFNKDGSFSGYAEHSGMYVNGSGYYTLARLNFSGKYTCEVHNVLVWVYADDNIRYSQGKFNKEMLPESSKKEIFANIRNYVEEWFRGSGGLCYEDDDLNGFKKAY